MSKKEYTLAELVERSVAYFASNPDVAHLLAVTSTGKFYRPEFESYAQHAASLRDGEVISIDRELTLLPEGMSYAEAFGEDGLVVPVETPAPSALAEAVAGAVRLSIPEPAAPASKPQTVNIVIDTRPTKDAVDAAVARALAKVVNPESAPAAPAKRAYKPRAPKPAAEAAPESAPAAPTTRKPRAPKPAAAQATATKKKAPTKTTK